MKAIESFALNNATAFIYMWPENHFLLFILVYYKVDFVSAKRLCS